MADGNQINNGNSTAGGIFISSVNGAVVENCVVSHNCFNCSGGVGLWAFDANRVIFQDDESFDNRTASALDGDGFDFDHGTTNSIMQRDYSHGNQGVAFLLTTFGGTSNSQNDIIRYCVGEDNGQFLGNSGIVVLGSTEPVLNASIYNNTILTTGELQAITISQESAGANIAVLNNLFYSDRSNLITVDAASSAGLRMVGNDYWISDPAAPLNISWGTSNFSRVADLANSTGQETVKGKVVGEAQDPQLVNAGISDLPAADLSNLLLAAKSPLQREAASLALSRSMPYGLRPSVLSGSGPLNIFHHRINPRAIGAG